MDMMAASNQETEDLLDSWEDDHEAFMTLAGLDELEATHSKKKARARAAPRTSRERGSVESWRGWGMLKDPLRYRSGTASSVGWLAEFVLPAQAWDDLVTVWREKGWYNEEGRSAAGKKRSALEPLLWGCLAILGHKRSSQMGCANSTGLGAETHRDFFWKFCEKMISVQDDYFKIPTSEAELKACTDSYAKLGLPGCWGSVDGVHIELLMCAASETMQHKGYKKKVSRL